MKVPAWRIMTLLAFILVGIGIVSAQSTQPAAQPADTGRVSFHNFQGRINESQIPLSIPAWICAAAYC